MKINTQSVVMFAAALQDCFKEEEDRELDTFGKIDLEKVSGNELILEMFYAFLFVFCDLTSAKPDVLEFLNILHRLILKEAIEQAKEEITHATPESNE